MTGLWRMISMALSASLLLAAGCAPLKSPETATSLASAARPNIVIVYADDMAWGDMSANQAGAFVETPNLDALAASGIRFSDGYSAAPVCGPARTALLTGAYANRSGVWWNPDTGKADIASGQTLLPALLRDAGYSTAVVGKWNLPTDPADAADVVKDPMVWGGGYWPNADGSYEGVGKGGGSGAGGRASGLWGPEKPDDEYLTDRLTRHGVDFIAAQDGSKPFFLYLAYNGPHSPLEAHQRYRARVAHLDSEPKRLYAAMVLAVDDGVSAIRRALREKGLEQNTLVIFLSDNGPAKSGFRGYQPDWPREVLGSVGNLSGTKGTYREGGIRVPFVMSWPAAIRPGQQSSTPMTALDLYPTLAELAGAAAKAPARLDGNSLVPLLRGQAGTFEQRSLVWAGRQCNRNGCRDASAVRQGAWKLLIEPDGNPQLFNLASDPAEATDLSAREPARVGAMVAQLEHLKAQFPANASGNRGPAGGGEE